MLNLVRDIVEHMEIREGESKRFQSIGLTCRPIDGMSTGLRGKNAETTLGVATAYYEKQVCQNHPSTLGLYFRTLYLLFKFIDEAPSEAVPSKQRIWYANIARAQVSDGAVLLLAFNGVTPRGDAFVRYIEEYGLLAHLHHKYRKTWGTALRLFYQPRAFMGSTERATAPDVTLEKSHDQFRADLTATLGTWPSD